MNRDNEFDKIIYNRFIPKPASNLVNRITEQASLKAFKKEISFAEQILKLFIIPKPAYATAICLLFGLCIGLYNASFDDVTNIQEWITLLNIDDQEWL